MHKFWLYVLVVVKVHLPLYQQGKVSSLGFAQEVVNFQYWLMITIIAKRVKNCMKGGKQVWKIYEGERIQHFSLRKEIQLPPNCSISVNIFQQFSTSVWSFTLSFSIMLLTSFIVYPEKLMRDCDFYRSFCI